MASSIVHLAITNELTKHLSFTDKNRLFLGAVVVDYGYDGNSHLKINVCDDKKKTYDFDRYRELFGERMLTDDLYLGYYLHLVQDSLYRHFVYDKYHWNPMIPGNVEKLHNDYSIVNYYVATKYNLTSEITVPSGFERETLCNICSFNTAKLCSDMESYFIPVPETPIFFFSKEMSDEFIVEATDYCTSEIERIRRGEPGINMIEFAWERA